MNIYDISQKSGVSIATVSRVMNGSSHVSEKTRQKVLSVIESENYNPNVFARGLCLNTIKTIGILYCDASDLYLANAVYHLERNFQNAGYNSLICCCGYELENKKKYINLMLSKKVDAIVLAGSHFVEEYEDDNQYIHDAAKQLPVALLNGQYSGENIISACCNDQKALYEIGNYLLQHGSKQIIFIYGVPSNSIRRKIAGLKEAYAANNLVFKDKYAVHYPIVEIDACSNYLNALRRQLHFDAIICNDDLFAVSALKFAQREHLAVPDELKIMGYNNSILSHCTSPELSTVDNRVSELCDKLAKMVVNRINGNETETEYILSGNLIFRDTT